jgi:hypothetical protein
MDTIIRLHLSELTEKTISKIRVKYPAPVILN